MNRKAFARYARYKDSGVEWLGEVPVHWDVKRVKDIGLLVLGKMLDKTKADNKFSRSYLKSRNIGWLKVDISNVDKMYFTYVEMKTYRLQTGDILLSEGGEVGKTAIWENNLDECYIQNSVHKLTVSQGNCPRYFLYYSFMLGHMQYYESIVNQVSIKHLTKEKLLRVQWLCPSLSEQRAIANYLDAQTTNIDRQIELLEQKAAHYADLKQSLINRTVTRGLDPTVPLRDSGVEWIGQIPAHWSVNKISQSFRQIGSGNTPKSGSDLYHENGTINWINTGDLNDAILLSCKKKVTPLALKDYSLKIYPPGSLIIAMYGATIGKVSISGIEGCTNQACCVLNRSNIIDIKFLFYWFLSKRDYIISLSYGGGQPNISQDTIKSLRVSTPPFPEQHAIADYLDTKSAHIDRIIAAINTKIARLQELRKTLINDVVTGKVRIVE